MPGISCKTKITSILDSDADEDVLSEEDMEWAEFKYQLSDVDAAGEVLLAPARKRKVTELLHAVDVIDNWRSAHAFPLNTFQVTLRRKAHLCDENALVAQRLKRLSSIHFKLHRLRWLKLAEMQDIGGCRAIVGSVRDVYRLVKTYKNSDLKHNLVDKDDYIKHPKRSGYRSIHLIYSYHSDKSEKYEGMKIEMQFRTKLQHAWATAVETVGAFTQQALKSSIGREDWLYFFKLASSELALREGTRLIRGTPKDEKGLKSELQRYADKLKVKDRLMAYRAALQATEKRRIQDARFYLLSLDTNKRELTIRAYRTGQAEWAAKAYNEIELKNRDKVGVDAVLVSVDQIGDLKSAYPNYFADTSVFLEELEKAGVL
jgi:rRNA processing protein Gar1